MFLSFCLGHPYPALLSFLKVLEHSFFNSCKKYSIYLLSNTTQHVSKRCFIMKFDSRIFVGFGMNTLTLNYSQIVLRLTDSSQYESSRKGN